MDAGPIGASLCGHSREIRRGSNLAYRDCVCADNDRTSPAMIAARLDLYRNMPSAMSSTSSLNFSGDFGSGVNVERIWLYDMTLLIAITIM